MMNRKIMVLNSKTRLLKRKIRLFNSMIRLLKRKIMLMLMKSKIWQSHCHQLNCNKVTTDSYQLQIIIRQELRLK